MPLDAQNLTAGLTVWFKSYISIILKKGLSYPKRVATHDRGIFVSRNTVGIK
jgi:hypothetical protein